MLEMAVNCFVWCGIIGALALAAVKVMWWLIPPVVGTIGRCVTWWYNLDD